MTTNRTQWTIRILALLTVVCGISGGPSLLAQADESIRQEALNTRERVTLFTDRTLYAVNEKIRFRALTRRVGEVFKENHSRVLYVELLTPEGKAVAGGKFPNTTEGSSGFLDIPPEALTGNYLLRAYTRWMRNFGPRSFAYTALKIVNPYAEEVLENPNIPPAGLLPDLPLEEEGPVCRTDKQVYAPEEKVRLELTAGQSQGSATGEYCLTVIPFGMMDARIFPGMDTESDREFELVYLPEFRGIAVSGNVIRFEEESPVPSARLYFSLLGDRTDLQTVTSDELGRFILTLPDLPGTVELFVSPEPAAAEGFEVRIDQDFSSDPLPFLPVPYTLDSAERIAATRMARNMQVSRAYREGDEPGDTDSLSDPPVYFYGTPEVLIRTDDFVDLPTMIEIFENLVPGVIVKYSRGNPSLKIESLNPGLSSFDPLLMIDNIPVFDQGKFLAVNPAKIQRIEVIRDVYVKGDMIFGGVISLGSRQGDMAAVDLPAGSYFFDYQAFHPDDPEGPVPNTGAFSEQGTNSPAFSETRDRIPDTRNTLVWIDRISLTPDEPGIVEFRAGTAGVEYLVLVRGLNARGEPVCGKTSFRVEPEPEE